MPDETDNKIETQSTDAPLKSSDTVVKEVNQGRSDIVGQQKDYVDYLKQGGTSGITDEFGKPMYLISDAPDKLPDVMSKGLGDGLLDAAKAIKDGASDAIKELAKPLMPSADSGPYDFFAGRDDLQGQGTISDMGNPRAALDSNMVGQAPAGKDVGTVTDAKGDKGSKPGDTTADAAKPQEPYKGEDIYRDVEAGWHTPKKGETLSSIAKDHLGQGATEEEIKKYATEIAKNNKLDPDKPGNIEGKELNLPGHTKDGGYSVQDSYGNTRTSWKDGSEKVERWDGRTSERHPTDGGYNEKHTGPRPEDNYTLEKTKDGKFLIAEKGETPHEVQPGSEDVRVERAKIEALAESKITDPMALAKFRADMLRFEDRAAKQDPPLSPQEINETYKQQEKLLTATGNEPLTEKERVKLAEQVMSNCANPTSIDQGHHNTCGVASVESRMYTRSPAEAARVVADVATTGKYKTADGSSEIVMDPASIKPCQDEARKNPPDDGDRSHASQIFQVAAINTYYQSHGIDYTDANGVQHHVPPGKVKYEQQETKMGSYPPETGERLYDMTQTPPAVIPDVDGKPLNAPGMPDGSFKEVADKMSGKKDAIDIGFAPQAGGDPAHNFNNEQEMKDQIAKAKAEHKLPIMMKVHTGNEPFFHDSGGGKAGGSGGWHAVCITDYDEKTGKVTIDNQWGSNSDHPSGDKAVSTHDLFMASRSPDYKETTLGFETGGTMHDLKKDIEYDREHGTVDTRKELELLRLQNKSGELSDKDYQEQLKKTIDDANERWAEQQKDGTFNQAEHDNAVQKMHDMTQALPPTERMDMLQKEYQRNIIKSKEYDDELVNGFREFSRQKPEPSAEEKQQFAKKYQELLNNLPPERRQDILDRA